MQRIRSLFLVPLLLFCAWAHADEPLTSFETDAQSAMFAPAGVTAERVQEHATDGKWALKVKFPGGAKDTWPGIRFTTVPADWSKKSLLSFDVYNPGDTVSLSWRIDSPGKQEFGGAKLPGKRMTTVDLNVQDVSGSVDLSKITGFFPYIRMPRKDVVLVFDNFRFRTLESRFIRYEYRETAPPITPTAAEAQQGLILFHRPSVAMVFRNTRPQADERCVRLTGFATPGEREPLTVAIYALDRPLRIQAQMSDLTCAGGGAIPASAVELGRVRFLNKKFTYSSRQYTADMPCYVEPLSGAFSVPARESQPLWATVNVPATAAAGVYTATMTLTVQPEGSAPAALKVPVRFRVLPFRLAAPRGMFYGEYYRGMRQDGLDDHVGIRQDLEDMRAHGMTSVGLCFGIDGDSVAVKDGKPTVNFTGGTRFEYFMDTYRDLGFEAPVLLLSDTPQSVAAAAYPLNSDDFARTYKALWTQIKEAAAQRHWPEIIVQPVDEPGWQDHASKDRNVRCLKLLKEIPGLRTEQDGPGDDYFFNEAGPHADLWNFNGDIADPARTAQVQKDGHTVLFYNNDVEGYRPEVDRYAAGFFQWAAGTNGCYNWEYRGGPGSWYNDLDGSTGDWIHRYPPTKESAGGPSTGWEGTREGVDDYRYIQLLRDTIDRARKQGKSIAAERAEERLQFLRDTLDYSPAVRGRAQWTAMVAPKNGQPGYVEGQLKQPNGWNLGFYERARWLVAETTTELLTELGELPKSSNLPARPIMAEHPQARIELVTKTDRAAQTETVTRPTVRIPRLATAPVIDGNLDDAAWKQAAHIPGFHLAQGSGDPTQQTEVWLGQTPETLYFGFLCHEDRIKDIRADITKDGGNVWEDDCVELFFDANLDHKTFAHIAVNSLCKVYLETPDGRPWPGKIEVAAHVGTNAWTVELGVPRRALHLQSDEFGLNLCRERRPIESLELSCWSPTGGGFGQPDKFGVAYLNDPVLVGVDLGTVRVGENTAKIRVCNTSKAPWQAVAVIAIDATDSSSQPVAIPPGEERTITVPFTVARQTVGRHDIEVSVRTARTPEPVVSHTYTIDIPSPATLQLQAPVRYQQDTPMLASLSLNIGSQDEEHEDLQVRLRRVGDTTDTTYSFRCQPPLHDVYQLRIDTNGLPAGEYVLEIAVASAEKPQPDANAHFFVIPAPAE